MQTDQKTFICPACGHTRYNFLMSCKDHLVSQALFGIVECARCGMAATFPAPEIMELGRYYESKSYYSHSEKADNFMGRVYRVVRKISLTQKIKRITAAQKTISSVLDIGCGTGEFLLQCREKGWTVTGIEPSDAARKFANEKYHIDVREEEALASFPDKSFDVITMWHVLEHVPDINARLLEVSRLLGKNGLFIVAVPNRQSYDANYYREQWAAYDVPRHLWHFRRSDITSLLAKYDMEIKTIAPMKFDSYYVSLLSEKYKAGKSRILPAIWRGWLSNRKGGNDNTSSLIYLIRKKQNVTQHQ